jgi:hypothetical protein
MGVRSRNGLGASGARAGSLLVALVSAAAVLAGCSSNPAPVVQRLAPSVPARTVGGVSGGSGYLVYWDQNEEVDFLSVPSGTLGQLMPAWDLNGQVCVVPDGTGRFVGGLDPTLPGQHNSGGQKPYKQPAIGEELDLGDGSFSGQVLYVPGPYKMPGQRLGEDSPADAGGVFNNQSTYTGCVFDRRGDLLAADIATAQGQFPSPDDGRLVEWFAPSFTTYCIVYGPTRGGVGPHHVDGHGGLAQPGTMALADNGDVLLPEAGSKEVLRFAASSLPGGPAECPGGLYPRSKVRVSDFLKRGDTLLAFPGGVARDPTCDCIAVSSYIGDPAIAWFTQDGKPAPGRTPVPGTRLADLGKNPDAYSPFGIAFAPDGTLYFVDIHVACTGPLTGCGPADYGGRVLEVAFSQGTPGAPVVVAGGFDFPTSVTVCVPAHERCPYPTGRIVTPASGPSSNSAPEHGPSSLAPATAGFGT